MAAEFIVKNVRFEFLGSPGDGHGGLSTVSRSSGGSSPSADNLEKCWLELFMRPGQRQRGVGSALLTWTEQRAKEGGRQLLLARPSCRPEPVVHPVRRPCWRRGVPP